MLGFILRIDCWLCCKYKSFDRIIFKVHQIKWIVLGAFKIQICYVLSTFYFMEWNVRLVCFLCILSFVGVLSLLVVLWRNQNYYNFYI